MKPLLVSSGEPAGVGPDLCLALARLELPLVVIGDLELLRQRAKKLDLQITFNSYKPDDPIIIKPDHLTVLPVPCVSSVITGQLNSENSSYVINMLSIGIDKCLSGEFSALITAPVHKAIINEAGYKFTGHTEFLAHRCKVDTVVMLLACREMKVALVTTHLPIKDVASALSQTLINNVIWQLNSSLKKDFGINQPRIYVAGLNPHAGEGGYLGREEIDIIVPALEQLKRRGVDVYGPFPADTMFNPANTKKCDAFVAMYHDQGLPVLKYVGFGSAVNITLGLPIIRTSVDHGTALDLAGTGLAEPGSLIAAVEIAASMVTARERK